MRKRYVIGDIHGCLKTFLQLIEEIQPDHSDRVILLGDYISKGPEPLLVLEAIKELESKTNLIALRGNHDQFLLDYYSSPTTELEDQLIEQGNEELLALDAPEKNKLFKLVSGFPLWHEDNENIYVHAGLNFDHPNPFQDTFSLLNIRQMNYRPTLVNGKRIIHGHVPEHLDTIVDAIASEERIVGLDNGCVYKNTPQLGNLVCLDLFENRIITVANVDDYT
ncbi:metallophosphoesterase [Marinoscillum sp. MHG1-6]|uniref:metallophosphoesterase n=1 Tax=Marinoscillum sp. MHG1-6 TaxID=2959627 RepID=UPI0021586D5A|nr:metallophosphoesterase [Marinoscillum sp. MHG1-6]